MSFEKHKLSGFPAYLSMVLHRILQHTQFLLTWVFNVVVNENIGHRMYMRMIVCTFYKLVSIVKPTRCIIFEFIEYHSTCFGRPFRPSSEVQDCTHKIRYTSYRLVDCLLAGTSCPLTNRWLKMKSALP
jgi:hypothetical protein